MDRLITVTKMKISSRKAIRKKQKAKKKMGIDFIVSIYDSIV